MSNNPENDFGCNQKAHRNLNRYHCPPFFEARIFGGGPTEEQAKVEDISISGLSIRTCCQFVPGSDVLIELKSSYVAPVKLHARVRWISPEEADSARIVGFCIRRVSLLEWLKYRKIIARLKKELW